MNNIKVKDLVNYILQTDKKNSGWIQNITGYNIPNINVIKYPPVNTMLKSINPPKYKFNTVFINEDPQLFDPNDLKFTEIFLPYVSKYPLFIVNNGYGKSFLVYVGRNIKPQYIWELDYTIPEEEPEEVLGAGPEGEAGEEDTF